MKYMNIHRTLCAMLFGNFVTGLNMADTGIQIRNESGDDTDMDLNDLLGVDFDDVDEYRSGPFPQGRYHWRIKSALMERVEAGTPKKPRACITVGVECMNTLRVDDDTADPTMLVGRVHNERFFIIDARRALGEFKAFANDIGMTESGALQDILNRMVGMEFEGPIKHQRNKDDADRPYVNLDRAKGKLIPIDSVPGDVADDPAAA